MKSLLKRFRQMVERRKVLAEELGSIDRSLSELRELLGDAPAAAVDRRTTPERRKVERRKPRKYKKRAAVHKKDASTHEKPARVNKPAPPPAARKEPLEAFDEGRAIATLAGGPKSTREIAGILGLGEKPTKAALSSMAKAGKIELVGWARGAKWRAPTAAVARAQRPAPAGFDVVFDGTRGNRPN